nr:DUF3524 domain-containing protein [Desulfobulbaceae bacterium]
MNIAVFEPYYGGSHKAFLKSLQGHFSHNFNFYTLPASKWKWRMRLAAPYFASLIANGSIALGDVDSILCSSFLDVAVFKGLLPLQYKDVPIYTYFHENQFAYPVQVNHERDVHFSLTNLTTALASDKIAFNSHYNLDTFLTGSHDILRLSPDMQCDTLIDSVQKKAVILYPGIDFQEIDKRSKSRTHNDVPVILWNHRWEHDKNPELFFTTLTGLKAKGIDFRLIVMGKSFNQKPPSFEMAHHELADKILHFGYIDSREEYIDMLCLSDIVVSTSIHEFYGISVIEAVRAGCCPLLPDRLSYKELFPDEFRYCDSEFEDKLIDVVINRRIDLKRAHELTDSYGWHNLFPDYSQWLNTN